MSTKKVNSRSAFAESTDQETEQREDGCPECEGEVIKDGTEAVCRECGLVTDTCEIDLGPEWRAFSFQQNQEKSRVGAPVVSWLHDRGMSTKVGGKVDNLDEKARRLRKWQTRTTMGNGKQRGLQDMMGEIGRTLLRRLAKDIGGEAVYEPVDWCTSKIQ